MRRSKERSYLGSSLPTSSSSVKPVNVRKANNYWRAKKSLQINNLQNATNAKYGLETNQSQRSGKGKTPRGLKDLPAELISAIMCCAPDLATLYGLSLASYRFRSLFEASTMRMTEAVIAQGTDPQMQQLIRTLIILKKWKTISTDFQSFLSLHLDSDPNSYSLPYDCDMQCKEVCQMAYQIHHLSLEFFEKRLAQIRKLRPRHLRDHQQTAFPRNIHTLGRHDKAPVPGPGGAPYSVSNTGPPSPLEHFRVNRALWRLQIICELEKKDSGHQKRNIGHSHAGIFERTLTTWEIDELITLMSYFDEAKTSPHKATRSLWGLQEPVRWHPLITASLLHGHRTCPMHYAFKWNVSRRWGRSADEAAHGVQIFLTIRNSRFYPYVWQDGFEPFMVLGFCIWDQDRLQRLGMAAMESKRPNSWRMGKAGCLTLDNHFYTWRSVDLALRRSESSDRPIEYSLAFEPRRAWIFADQRCCAMASDQRPQYGLLRPLSG